MYPLTNLNPSWLTALFIIGSQLLLPELMPLHARSLPVHSSTSSQPPNILFIIMDDVGIDQLNSYNLPSTQVSPYEVTTPRVLANAGYTSALIGKYHLGGPDNNPAGYGAPAALGWNYYN